jgi:hypothetical protein
MKLSHEQEELVFDSCVRQARRVLPELNKWFLNDQHVPDLLISWPREPIRTDDMKVIDGLCIMHFPKDVSEDIRKKAIKNTALRTKAYALLLSRTIGDKMLVIFEASMGTYSWEIPISRHGDLKVLGEPVEHQGRDRIGVLLP